MMSILSEMGVLGHSPVALCVITMLLFNNHIFHEHTLHIEVDCHFVHDMVLSKKIQALHVQTGQHIVDIFTKPLMLSAFNYDFQARNA